MITMKVERITPAKAEAYLTYNTENRRPRRSSIAALSNAIERGEWLMTHQGIAFSSDGRLIDGQHRLLAVSRSGQAVDMLVFRNVPDAAFAVIDQGQRRSPADVLRTDVKTAAIVRLAARLMYRDGSVNKVSASQLIEMCALIGPEVESLLNAAKGHAKYFCSAAFQLAAVAHLIANPKSAIYVKETYRALINCDVDAMSPVARSILKQHNCGTVDPYNESDTLSRSWTVFNPANAGLTRVQVSDPSTAVASVRAVLQRRIDENAEHALPIAA